MVHDRSTEDGRFFCAENGAAYSASRSQILDQTYKCWCWWLCTSIHTIHMCVYILISIQCVEHTIRNHLHCKHTHTHTLCSSANVMEIALFSCMMGPSDDSEQTSMLKDISTTYIFVCLNENPIYSSTRNWTFSWNVRTQWIKQYIYYIRQLVWIYRHLKPTRFDKDSNQLSGTTNILSFTI